MLEKWLSFFEHYYYVHEHLKAVAVPVAQTICSPYVDNTCFKRQTKTRQEMYHSAMEKCKYIIVKQLKCICSGCLHGHNHTIKHAQLYFKRYVKTKQKLNPCTKKPSSTGLLSTDVCKQHNASLQRQQRFKVEVLQLFLLEMH